MSDDPRASILAQFAERWGDSGAERRILLLEETLPELENYVRVNNNFRTENKLHPTHLEMYVEHLRPRVRSVIEFCSNSVISSIEKSLSSDERIAKIIKVVNMLDAKAEQTTKER